MLQEANIDLVNPLVLEFHRREHRLRLRILSFCTLASALAGSAGCHQIRTQFQFLNACLYSNCLPFICARRAAFSGDGAAYVFSRSLQGTEPAAEYAARVCSRILYTCSVKLQLQTAKVKPTSAARNIFPPAPSELELADLTCAVLGQYILHIV